MKPVPGRRILILAEGQFASDNSKTARGVLRYGPDPVVAVLDSTLVGRRVGDFMDENPRYAQIPFVATLGEGLELRATTLLIGIAPAGGQLPGSWRGIILAAIDAGLEVVSGLHLFLGDDPEFAIAASHSGAAIVDLRRPPDRTEISRGRGHLAGRRVVLMVGTDCAVGKMSVALELTEAAKRAHLRSVFVPTGQTGMIIAGWGVTVDRVASDFLQGTTEWLVEQAEAMGDWVFVEGQGSLDHPAYSSVTLGLIHGATPHAMVMVHQVGRTVRQHWDAYEDRLEALPSFIAIHEAVAGLVAPSKVVGVALNTSRIRDEGEARSIIATTSSETGLPTDDPFRFGGDRLFAAIRPAIDEAAR